MNNGAESRELSLSVIYIVEYELTMKKRRRIKRISLFSILEIS